MLKNKNAIRIAAVGIVGAALVGASATSAMAATSNGSDSVYYLYDSGTETLIDTAHVNAFDDDLVGSPAGGGTQADARTPFSCPVDATTVRTFISPVGQEKVLTSWVAYADGGFNPGTKDLIETGANLSAQILGAPASVRSAGGNYSLGVACLKDNSVNLASAGIWFAPISVTPATGAWTYALSNTVTPPAPPSGSFDTNLQATTIAAQDGVLTLVAPSAATVVIGNPTLVNGLSTSTAQLGEFSVQDGRVVSHPGWTVTTSVNDFVNSADNTVTIDKKQLGIAPVLVSQPTGAAATVDAATVAGQAVYPGAAFAEASNAAAVGNTVLNANLTFVAPADKPAGTYNSKLTVTLTSK